MSKAIKRSAVARTYKRDGVTYWKCTGCGTEHDLPAYVHAHWDDELIHTCECGAKHSVCQGHIERIKEGQ